MNEPFKEFCTAARNNTLSAFIDESKTRLKEILKRLEWNIDPNIDTHTSLKNGPIETQTVFDFESEFPPSCASENFIVTGADELRTILGVSHKDVPKGFSDLQLNFSRTEKLALYEHVITNTKKCTEPEITVQLQGVGASTFAEIVAEKKRETKKRRRYRRSKPTHIEEVRAVVDLQMQSLQQYLKENVTEVQNYQLMTDKYRSKTYQDDSSVRGTSRKTHTSAYFRNNDRSRSRNYERKSYKKSRHRSRSVSNSHKRKKSKKHRSDRSSNKNRSHRSRSRSAIRRKTHKRRSRSKRRSHSRSRSKRRSHSRSRSSNRNKPHHRQRRE